MADPQASTSYLLPSTSQPSRSIYHSFADTLRLAKDRDLSELLDPDGGVARSFAEICMQRAEAASLDPGVSASTNAFESDTSEDSKQAWEAEAQTWNLVQLLVSERLTRVDSPLRSGQGNPYQTPLATVQSLLDEDERLNELNLLRSWLSSILVPTSTIEVRKGYRTFTKARLRNEKRLGIRGAHATRMSMGLAAGSGAKGVKSLDPDATCRGEGILEQEDAIYERAVTRSLFEYARSGQLELAMDLARQTGHSWRSASLRGGMLYWAAGLSYRRHRPGEDNDVEIDVDEEIRQGLGGDGGDDTMGNVNRSLWKAVCAKVASNPSLDPYERALYGSLCGDVHSVLPVSHSWAAQLWVHVNSVLEIGLDERLDDVQHRSSADGAWWSQSGLRDVESRHANEQTSAAPTFESHEGGAVRLESLKAPTSRSRTSKQDSEKSQQKRQHDDLEGIFNALSQSSVEAVRLQSNEPFHVVQRALIVDEVPAVLAMLASRLDPIREGADRVEYIRLVRFFAHFVIYLRLVGYTSSAEDPPAITSSHLSRSRQVDPAVCNSLLSAYVEILQETQVLRQQQLLLHGQAQSPDSDEGLGDIDELVAMYASALEPESAVRSFAMYLRSIDIDASMEVRRSAFKSAQKHNLDLAAVARTTVGLVFDEILPHLQLSSADDEFSIIAFDDRIDVVERELIRAIDWLTFDEATYGDALLQSNMLMRLFFVRGRLQAARALHVDLPYSIVALAGQAGPEDLDFVEHEEWKDFFTALDAHAVYSEMATRKPAERASKIEIHDWTREFQAVVERADEAITSLLIGDWLKLDLDGEGDDTHHRLADLQRIRQIYIPELVLRLHFVHYDARDVLPGSLSRALDLPNLVADERHKLYLEFVRPSTQRNRLREYLSHVREAALDGLDSSNRGAGGASRSGNPFAPVMAQPLLQT